MASFGRSFKPSSYLSSMKKRRPPPPSRNISSSSEVSPIPSPDIWQDDIVFSRKPSPNLTMEFPQHRRSGASPKPRPSGGMCFIISCFSVFSPPSQPNNYRCSSFSSSSPFFLCGNRFRISWGMSKIEV
ncbi:hypothetical protein M426DRAFT_249363 [Hypoxylon sp. CI-4A]|nr:hypothetical protein M426DRAFT_249363 [Hypoxylon sp. CI-4A]